MAGLGFVSRAGRTKGQNVHFLLTSSCRGFARRQTITLVEPQLGMHSERSG